jgi:putative transposase
VSNDNPYSEAQFKTLKYCPAFPKRFGSIADARVFCDVFFEYYNHEHGHSGIGPHTPASVRFGTVARIRAERARVLEAAYAHTSNGSTTNPSRPRFQPGHGSTSRAPQPSRPHKINRHQPQPDVCHLV